MTQLYVYRNERLQPDKPAASEYTRRPPALSGGGGWWSPYGGIVTTVDNYHRFCQTLLDYGQFAGEQVVGEALVREMVSNQIGQLDAYGAKYGLGIGVKLSNTSSGTTDEVFWSGSPYNTCFWINYRNGVIGILLTNTAPSGHMDMMDRFKELIEESLSERTKH